MSQWRLEVTYPLEYVWDGVDRDEDTAVMEEVDAWIEAVVGKEADVETAGVPWEEITLANPPELAIRQLEFTFEDFKEVHAAHKRLRLSPVQGINARVVG